MRMMEGYKFDIIGQKTFREITHLVEWIADVIYIFNLQVRQTSAVLSVHDALIETECKLAVRKRPFIKVRCC